MSNLDTQGIIIKKSNGISYESDLKPVKANQCCNSHKKNLKQSKLPNMLATLLKSEFDTTFLLPAWFPWCHVSGNNSLLDMIIYSAAPPNKNTFIGNKHSFLFQTHEVLYPQCNVYGVASEKLVIFLIIRLKSSKYNISSIIGHIVQLNVHGWQ